MQPIYTNAKSPNVMSSVWLKQVPWLKIASVKKTEQQFIWYYILCTQAWTNLQYKLCFPSCSKAAYAWWLEQMQMF